MLVQQKPDGGWWEGRYFDQVGWFPSDFVESVASDAGGDDDAVGAAGDAAAKKSSKEAAGAGAGDGGLALGGTGLTAAFYVRSITFSSISHAQVAVYDFSAQEDDELSLAFGDPVTVLQQTDPDWWLGTCEGAVGWFPAAYVEQRERIGGAPLVSARSSVSLSVYEPTKAFVRPCRPPSSLSPPSVLFILF